MAPPFKKIQDLWLPDGLIIIRAGDQICRVPRGSLASNSSVLSESMPQPSVAEKVDGLPVVTFPDPPEEVLHWLKAMLVPGYFEVFPSKITSVKLLAVLRLSHKYDVKHLRQRALHHLSTALPTDLASELALLHGIAKSSVTGPCHIDFYCSVNALAQEVGALWLLPSVLYGLHTMTWPDKEKLDNLVSSQLLTATDVLRLWAVARAVIAEFSISKINPHHSDGCPTNGCEDGPTWVLHNIYSTLLAKPLGLLNPPHSDGLVNVAHYVQDMMDGDTCIACREAVLQNHSKADQDFWDALPGSNVLGIPDWTELLAAKERDIGLLSDDNV
ncbi:hypothetical protein BD626DRAFT_568925 [Schizophyllum amplum]|uniref:BTB domain-containing protein n=1 Tax=Schizophyllum amplum TaxID=97359 RepID=A0A550CFF5_9AGAR|nr:hypothetical protein BD626DRAFT_568925 [Auriculariopsis ampla]